MRMYFSTSLVVALACGIAASTQGQAVNGVQAVVNDNIVTRYQVEELIAPLALTVAREYAGRPQEFNARVASLQAENTERLIEDRLILSDFKASNLVIPESIIEESIQDEIRNEYGSLAKLRATLRAQGMTYDKYRKKARDEIIIGVQRSRNIGQETIVSPYKIEQYYKASLTNYLVEEQVRLRMIVLNNSSDQSSAQKAIASDILTKLKQGVAFSEMASIHSQSAQKNEGGELGWVRTQGLRAELRDAASKLKAGELSDVIETPDAIYILLVEEKKPAHSRPLVEVSDEIEDKLLKMQHSEATKHYVEKLKKKNLVRYF